MLVQCTHPSGSCTWRIKISGRVHNSFCLNSLAKVNTQLLIYNEKLKEINMCCCYHLMELFFCFSIFIALFSLNISIHMIYTSCMCIFKLWNSIQTIFNCHKATGVHQNPERKEDQQWMSPWKLKKWNHEAASTHRHKHTPYRSPWIVNTSCPETGNN